MKRARIAAAGGVVVLVLSAGAWFGLRRGGEDRITASGTVEATTSDLGFQAGGRIAGVFVTEGERVTVGQELARLESAELEARRQAALAQRDAALAVLTELERGARPEELRQARAAEAAARERLEEARRTLRRTEALEAGGAVSREALELAGSAVEVARAQHEQAAEQLHLVQTGARAERVAAQQAAVRQADAAVAQVDAALQNATIHAPFDGVVTVRHRQPGEAVPAGAPVLTVLDLADRWVRIYVREDRVGAVTLGAAADIVWDGAPATVHAGRVTFIGSQAEFTPRSVQTAEQRVKLVYALKVAISGDSAHVLKPGLPVDVTLRP